MTDVTPEQWNSFYGACAGAAASLTGLMFVALSINLNRILAVPGLPGRGAESLAILSGVLVTALTAMIPGQANRTLGLEILGVGAIVWSLPMIWQLQSWRAKHMPNRQVAISRLILLQVAALPLLAGGGALMGYASHPRHWLAFGLLTPLVVSLLNAWVLLVEIMR
jgi:modulator of FtsH protease